jgi:signal transduction histidine kinase
MDLGQVFALKQNDIIQSWIAQVQKDHIAFAKENGTLESAHQLTYAAVLDSLPQLLNTLKQLLSRSILLKNEATNNANDEISLIKPDLQPDWPHCAISAKQSYDAEEIVREYSVLRRIIFDALEGELLRSQPSVLLRAMRLIEDAIDRVIACSLQRCTEERLRAVNLLYDELVASNQELEWLVRSEKNNLAHLAHELKSPLCSIIGYSDLFLRQYANGAQVHPTYVERVLTSGRQLLVMINEALEMSSYQAGKVKLNFESVQVCEVVEEVATVLGTLAQQKGLTMSIGCSLVNQPIVTDKGRLRQIVTNLISNAIRYTESGSIHVGVRLVNSTEGLLPEEMRHVEIAVVDTGLGIDVAEQDQIFQPYYRGKAGQQLSCSTGLGLAITYQMIKLLQGSIHLQSEPGGGSVFTIALPLAYQPEQNEAPADKPVPALMRSVL